MNRLHHLKETLLKNIEDNISYGKLEFILLDYNSSDGLEEWVKSKLAKYIDNGILKYHRTSEPKSFHRSHSRNVAMKLGSGDIVCNLDADNFLGNDFAHFINYHFSFNNNIFLCSGNSDGSYGKVCLKKDDFISIRGYDEKMSGWGYEDDDLYDRIEDLGKTKIQFKNKSFTEFINHEIEDSFLNDKNVLNIKDIYVQQVSYTESTILFLLKNNIFYYGRVIKPSEYENIELEKYWEKGVFQYNNNQLCLSFNGKKKIILKAKKNVLLFNNEHNFLKADEKLSNFLKIQFTALENKKKYQEKKYENSTNLKNWGKANLIKNFSKEIAI
jgi:hypothetical protein